MTQFATPRLDFGNINILWCNLSGGFVAGLDRGCPIRAVACLDDGADFDLIEARYGTMFLSHERATKRRVVVHDPGNDDITHFLGAQMRQRLSASEKSSWRIILPRPSAVLDDFAAQAGYIAVTHPASLCGWLNNKENFFQGRKLLGLPTPAGRWLPLYSTNYAELRTEFGEPLVLQAARGQGGSGTAIVNNETDFRAVAARMCSETVWCSPFLGRLSLNINAVATDGRPVVSFPSVQLVGLNPVGARPGKYCGNDFTAATQLERNVIEDAQSQTEKLGYWLTSLGYRGIFGVDFVIEEANGRAIAVDLNPRWQGSTSLETMASICAGRLPLALAELAYRIGVLSSTDLEEMGPVFLQPLTGSQMILHSVEAQPVVISEEVTPGVYAARETLTFLRRAIELGDCRDETDVLLTSGVVKAGTTLNPGARPCRVMSRRAVWDVTGQQPAPWVEPTIRKIYHLFGLSSPGSKIA